MEASRHRLGGFGRHLAPFPLSLPYLKTTLVRLTDVGR